MTSDRITQLFLDTVCDGGTPVATCDLCGKTWFQVDGEYMEPDGELERLQAAAAKDPDKYATTTDGSVSFGHVFGHQVVYYCRCEKVQKMAGAMWSNRQAISRFIRSVAEEMKNEAERALEEIPT